MIPEQCVMTQRAIGLNASIDKSIYQRNYDGEALPNFENSYLKFLFHF